MAVIKQQLFSRTVYDTDGTTTSWDFNFTGGYLSASHVKAYIVNSAGVKSVPLAGYVSGTSQFVISPALAVGFTLVIYRDTPKNLPLVDFADGSNFSEVALDTNAKQAVFLAAEAADISLTNEPRQAVSDPSKQPLLVSGVNVKTVGGNSLLGGGNLDVGDVVGPASAVPDTIAVFSGATGKAVKSSGVLLSSISTAISGKQDTLASGTNIKTVNGNSLLGAGDVTVPAGDVVGPASSPADGIAFFSGTTGKLLSASGTTLVGIATLFNTKQPTLVSGTNIKTVNGAAILGSGDLTVTDSTKQPLLASGVNIRTINGGTVLGAGDLTVTDSTKQPLLVSGTSIKTLGGQTLLGSGNIALPSGDVVGPVSSPNDALVAFDGTTGKLIKGAGLTVANINNVLATKQTVLVSGNNIRTINGQSVLGSGDIVVSGGGGGTGDVIGPASSMTSAIALFDGTTGKAIKNSGVLLANKQDTLVSGTNLRTVNGLSLLGSGNVSIATPFAPTVSSWVGPASAALAGVDQPITGFSPEATGAGVTLSGSQFTVPAGTWAISFSVGWSSIDGQALVQLVPTGGTGYGHLTSGISGLLSATGPVILVTGGGLLVLTASTTFNFSYTKTASAGLSALSAGSARQHITFTRIA